MLAGVPHAVLVEINPGIDVGGDAGRHGGVNRNRIVLAGDEDAGGVGRRAQVTGKGNAILVVRAAAVVVSPGVGVRLAVQFRVYQGTEVQAGGNDVAGGQFWIGSQQGSLGGIIVIYAVVGGVAVVGGQPDALVPGQVFGDNGGKGDRGGLTVRAVSRVYTGQLTITVQIVRCCVGRAGCVTSRREETQAVGVGQPSCGVGNGQIVEQVVAGVAVAV